MRFVLLGVLLLSVSSLGLSGCLEGGVSLMTAKQARGQADDAAERWEDDAVLVGAYGMEFGPAARERFSEIVNGGSGGEGGPPVEDEEDAGQRAMIAAVAGAEDDTPGDGKAPLWVFSYWSERVEGGLDVAITSEGVVHQAEGDGPSFPFGDGRQSIGDWRVDSDEGSQVAREDLDYERAVSDPEAMAFTVLVQGADSPLWLFGAQRGPDGGAGDDGSETFVAVDASTGEAIDAEDVLREMLGFVLREAGSSSGTATAGVGFTFSSEFDVELDGHGLLVVLVRVSPPPATTMTVVVTDPAGTEYTGSIVPAPGVDATEVIVVQGVPSGPYTVKVSTDLAVLHEWEISWCTDGEAVIPMGSDACDLLPDSAGRTDQGSGSETLSPPGRWPWA
jgi:hypothetical protein